jgi:hypothetical protein
LWWFMYHLICPSLFFIFIKSCSSLPLFTILWPC